MKSKNITITCTNENLPYLSVHASPEYSTVSTVQMHYFVLGKHSWIAVYFELIVDIRSIVFFLSLFCFFVSLNLQSCHFGSRSVGRGCFVFNRRSDHLRCAVLSMAERCLNPSLPR